MTVLISAVSDDSAVIHARGRLGMGKDQTKLRDAVREALAEGKKCLALDLGEVGYIDSAGLDELLAIYYLVRQTGGSVKLFNPSERVLDTLGSISQMASLIRVSTIGPSEAIRSNGNDILKRYPYLAYCR